MAPKCFSKAALRHRALVQRHRSPYYAHRILLVAAIALALLSCASASGSFAASNLRRVLQGIPRKSTRGQCTSVCPQGARCSLMRGAPVCKCPNGQRIQPDGTCGAAALMHSDWLDPMNNARAAVGSQPLKWDNSLAAEAQVVAQRIGRTGCALIHGGKHGHGQVLAGGPQRQKIDNTEAVNRGWVSEGALYSYARFNSKTASGCITGNWRQCGHYVQIVWEASRRVGCSVEPCGCCGGKGKIYVCHFDPPGNVERRFPYTLDPCYGVSCPGKATCDSSTGEAVCKCPPGQTNVNGKCVSDPCQGVSCSGDLVCNATSKAKAKCVCPPGRVPAYRGSTTCIAPSCANVACPSPATCAVGPSNTPFCDCGDGNVLQGGECTAAPTEPVPVTSVALWNAPSYTLAPAQPDGTGNLTAPVVLRFDQVGQCLRLDPEVAGLVGSYRILWNVWDAMGGLPPDAQAAPCRKVTFWPTVKCKGRGMEWSNPNVDNGITLSPSARGVFAAAKSIQCT